MFGGAVQKSSGIILSLVLLLSGCTQAVDVEEDQDAAVAGVTTEQADDSTETTIDAYPYPDCDSPAVEPLTVRSGYPDGFESYRATCSTDRTEPQVALGAFSGENNVDLCRLADLSPHPELYGPNALNVGFPSRGGTDTLPDGNYRVVAAGVDWPDLQDPMDIERFLEHHVEFFQEWFATYSRGKVSFDFYIHPDWITMPDSIDNYSQFIDQRTYNQWSDETVDQVSYFYNQVFSVADPLIDFTAVDMVLFVPPRQADQFMEFNLWPPGTDVFETDEGTIARGFTGGNYHHQEHYDFWSFWVHESMHYFQLPDLYWVDQDGTKASEATLPGPFQGYDILSSFYSMGLNSWLMWLAGWLDDSEVVCLTEENFQDASFEVFSNDQVSLDTKAIMLPLSEKDMIVIESRRRTQFDMKPQRARDGVLVYHVDTSIPHGEGTITLLAPEGRGLVESVMRGGNGDTPALDAILYEGNSIDIAGYHITVNQAKTGSDIVSVSRIPDWVPGSDPTYVCFTRENRDTTVDHPLSCPLVF